MSMRLDLRRLPRRDTTLSHSVPAAFAGVAGAAVAVETPREIGPRVRRVPAPVGLRRR